MSLTNEILSQLPGDPHSGLRRADRLLASIREGNIPVPTAVKPEQSELKIDWDVVICGGTLGILIGCALAQLGWQVALLERGILRGRDQEWNISRQELAVFLELNLLTQAELEQAIATEYNPARVGFHGGLEVWVEDVLNVGIDPVYLLEILKAKFLAAGGRLFENTSFASATVHSNGVLVETNNPRGFKTRLLVDAMGHFSPIVQQARQGKKPDSLCLVVGSCTQGFPKNDCGDLLVSFTPLQNQCQFFWEAFPARDGRTTYLFTYLDADAERPGLEALFEDYLRLLPQYQNVELNDLQIQRALFGFFPAYRQPLRLPWSRILPVGDSSGTQSPVSFGGFGAMIRHLKRLTFGINDTLKCDRLSTSDLALLQPYQPNIRVTWLFQKAMSVGLNQTVAPNQINQLLAAVFQEMHQLGDSVLKPFLQDVVQFPALTKTLLKTGLSHPLLVIKVIPQVGWRDLFAWIIHYFNLGIYAILFQISFPLRFWIKNLPPVPRYYCQRAFDAWEYGSGYDYQQHKIVKDNHESLSS